MVPSLSITSSSEKVCNLNNYDKILAPSLIVVGSQSSGKSSVLNGILSMDILCCEIIDDANGVALI